MANVYTPFGLRPVETIGSSGYVGRVREFYVPSTDATAIGLGDMVKLAGGADANGVATATRAGSTDTVLGVMVGVKPLPTDLALNYRKASTAMYILVDTDPNTVYEVVEVNTGTALTAAAVGLNANVTPGTVDTVTGNGKTTLDNDDEAVTATLDVQLLGLKQEIGNAFGAGAKWLVKLNNCQYVDGTTGIS